MRYCKALLAFMLSVLGQGFAADPHLHLRFNETTGVSATDSSGNGFTGTLANGTAFDALGLFRGAVLLDGVDDRVIMDNTTTLDFAAGEAFSVSLWLRTTDSNGSVLSFRNSTNGEPIVGIHVGFNGASNSPGNIMTIVRQNAGGGLGQVVGTAVNDGAWHHVVLVRTATQIELFKDGVSQGTNTAAQALGPITTEIRAIGTELRWVQDNVNSVDQRFLSGRVDDVRIYKRAISGAEITALTQSPTTTTLNAPASLNVGDTAALIATVTNVAQTINTGTVTFREGTTVLNTVAVNASGVATFTTGPLALGVHTFFADYTPTGALGESSSVGKTVNTLASITPEMHLKLNETVGTVAADSSGNNFNGTYVNGPTFTTGRIAGAAQMDGVNDHVRLNNTASLNFAANEPFTIAAWVRTTDANGPIVSFRNSADGDSLIDLCVGFNGASNNPGQVMVIVRGDAGGGFGQVVGAAMNNDAWRHVALVRTATQIELFLDGVSQGTSTAAQALGALTSDLRASGVELAWVAVPVNTADQQYLSGRVDDLRIYKRALTSGELVALTQPDTTTTLAAGAATVFGQNRTLTATVTHATQTVNGGTVTFREGATVLGSGAVNAAGVATLTLASLAAGTHNINAEFSGFSSFGESTSANASVVVNQAATTATIISSAGTSVFGQSVQFTATISATAPGAGTPTGTVQFFEGVTSLGAGTIASGQATLSISSLSVGVNSITAVYSGDTNFTASTSGAIVQTVNQAATITTLVSSLNPAPSGQAVTFTAQIAAVAPGGGTVNAGTVIFTVDGNSQTPVAVSSGTASIALTLPGLTHIIGAAYQGSTNYAASSATNLTQTMQIPPVANPQTVNVAQDRPTAVVLTGSDSASLPLTFSVQTPPANGSLSGTAPNLVYTPTAGFFGNDAFTFVVNNGQLSSTPATVSLIVLPPPSFTSQLSITPNPALAGQVISVTAAAGSALLSYNWGDGSSSVNNTHVYTEPGLYSVVIIATDPMTGLTSTQTATVFVGMVLDGGLGGGTGATPPGVTGILVGGSGAGASAGGSGKIVCNYVRREKTSYSGSLGTLKFPSTLTQTDLAATSCVLRLGTGSLSQQFYFELDKNGRGRATDVKQIELSVKKKRFKFKVSRSALTDLTEALGGPREFQVEKRTPVTLLVPATVQIGTKLFLALTFQVSYQQINNGGKGNLSQ